MSARKYNSNIYDQDSQAWRYGGSRNIDSASIDDDKILSITLADGQPVIATGRAGHFSATPDFAGRIFYSNGNVGIGPVQNPPTSLYVSSNNTASVSVATYSDTHSPKITIDNARGNSDSPQDAAVDDISSLVFRKMLMNGIWVNSGVIRSQLKNIDGKSNLDFYVNGGSGEERAISVLSNKSIIMSGSGTDSGVTISDGLIEMRTANGSPAKIDLYCEVNNAHKITIAAPAHADFNGNVNFGLPGSNGSDGQALVTDGLGNTRWATASGISDSDGNTKIQVEESADENIIRFDTAGTQRMIIDETGKVGIGTNFPSEMLHLKSVGKAALSIEADINPNGLETNTAYIKLSQDNAVVTGYAGFCSNFGKSPEDTAYGQEDDNNTKALSNAHLISNDWASPDAAVQIGTQSSVIATFRNGRVGIGKTNPSSLLDVNGEIAADSIDADSVIAGSVDVNGRLTFKELIFGAAQSYGGVAKYPIRELNDVLWRADVRSGNSINDTGPDGRQIFYPKNNHGESINRLQSLLDRGDDQVVPIITDRNDPGGPGPSGDLFISETSWYDQGENVPLNEDGTEGPRTPISTLPSVLFDGLWSNAQKLRHDETHTFVINFMKHKNFSNYGLSYGEGKVYIGFLQGAANFSKIKLEGFYLQSAGAGFTKGIANNTGRWVECCDPVTSLDDERNVSISSGNYYFELTISNASSVIRPVINQRTGDVMDPVGAKRSDYYLSALRITIVAGSLPLNTVDPINDPPRWTSHATNQEFYDNTDFRGSNTSLGCWPSDMVFMPTRRQAGLETSLFHKFEDMSTIPGGIYFNNGTATNPTVTFTSGDDYGIFYDSENSQMGLSGGGNEAITIDASGDVTKLGQDVPAQNDVLTWDGAKAVWSPNAAAAGITEVLEDPTPQLGGNLDVNGNSITSSGDLDISINSSGPGAVHVAGSEPTISIQRGSNDNPSSLDFVGAVGFVGAYVRHIENQFDAGGTNNDLVIGTGAPVTERIRITGDGRVGIGITNPDKQLHVASDIKVDGTTTLNGAEYTWPAADGQSGQALITNGSGDLSWTNASSIAGIESQQIMIDFNVNTRPNSPSKNTVYSRVDGVGNIDGGAFTIPITISSLGTGTPQPNFDRDTDTTFVSSIQQARNNLICGFVSEDSSLVKLQSIVLPKNTWTNGIYISIWKGTYTNHSSGDITWNRVSLIQAVNDQGTPDTADDSLGADTVCFAEDIIELNNSFSKGDLWSLLFWSDEVASGGSSAPTWVTGNLFFEKD